MSGRHLAKLDGLMESLGRLKSVWASQGIECAVPATHAELAEFEEGYRVWLPDDLREYFLRVNGMARNGWWQWDDDLISRADYAARNGRASSAFRLCRSLHQCA
jgi:hypothetical protein